MFSTIVRETVFTDASANAAMQNIRGDNVDGDSSFLTTMRALLYNRIKTDSISFEYVSYRRIGMRETMIKSMEEDYGYNLNPFNGITLCNISDDAYDMFIGYYTNESNVNSGWQRLDKISVFFERSFNIACFINPEQKGVVLLVPNLDFKKLHYIQSAMLAFLPWYFDKNISEKEMALIKTLASKNATLEAYLRCINDIAKDINLREMVIRNTLNNIEASVVDGEIAKKMDRISSLINDINGMMDRLNNYIRAKREEEDALSGLMAKQKEAGSTEIMDYFLANERLAVKGVYGSLITFTVSDYLDNFDPDKAEIIVSNKRSFLYNCSDTPKEVVERMFSKIFIDQELRIRVYGQYVIDLAGDIRADRSAAVDNMSICNPHLFYHMCLGGNIAAITDRLASGNYAAAIAQCIESCKSINLIETPTSSPFVSNFLFGRYSSEKFLEKEDGTIISPKEAIKEIAAELQSEL